MREKCLFLASAVLLGVFLLASPGWGQGETDVESLILDLKSEDWITRQSAAEALGETKDPRAVEPLIAALQDENRFVREAVVRALGEIKDPRAIGPLISALLDEDDDVRTAATEALEEVSPNWMETEEAKQAILKLIIALADERIRTVVEEALERINPNWRATEEARRAVLGLASALKDENPSIRMVAAETLGVIQNPRAIEPLVLALTDEYPYVRGTARKALERINPNWMTMEEAKKAVPKLIATLRDRNKERSVREAAIKTLAEIKDPRAIEPLVIALMDDDLKRSSAVEEALEKMDPDWRKREETKKAVLELISALKDPDSWVRAKAAWALGKVRDSIAVEPLVLALKDPDREVREGAAWALGEIKDPRALGPLILALADEDRDTRSEAEVALEKINPNWMETEEAKGVVPEIVLALKNENWEVREKVAWALGEIKDPRAVEPLILALKDPDSRVREGAAWALGEIKDPRALGPLILALADEVRDTRSAAEGALKKINPNWMATEEAKGVVPELILALVDEVRDIRIAAERTLEEINPNWMATEEAKGVVPELILALKNENREVREKVAWALGEIKDPRAVEPLILALKDDWLCNDVARALGKIGDPRAIGSLVLTLIDEDKYTREEARKALEKINPNWMATEEAKGVVPELILALKDPDSRVREGAAWALGEIKDPRALGPLILALADEVRDTRSAAEGALKKINPNWMATEEAKGVVPELILVLKNENREVRERAAWVLKAITGQNFGEDHEAWTRWREENKAKFGQ